LTDDERTGIVLAVNSAFTKLRNLYQRITPIFHEYGFTPPSAGVIARDLSEKIEKSIVQHCPSFSTGTKHVDLGRLGQDWEVKICKDSGLTINQSKQVAGENYIVVNYRANIQVSKVWVLWNAQDAFFSPRKPNTNARSLLAAVAQPNIEVLFTAGLSAEPSLPLLVAAKGATALPTRAKPARAVMPSGERKKSSA
jgi:hypothetical protein